MGAIDFLKGAEETVTLEAYIIMIIVVIMIVRPHEYDNYMYMNMYT